MKAKRSITVPGGYDPARFFKGLELHQQLDAAMAPGEASLQEPLTALEKDKFEQFMSRFAEIHFPILA